MQVIPSGVGRTSLVFELYGRIVEVPPCIVKFNAQLFRLKILIIIFDDFDSFIESARSLGRPPHLGVGLGKEHQ